MSRGKIDCSETRETGEVRNVSGTIGRNVSYPVLKTILTLTLGRTLVRHESLGHTLVRPTNPNLID